MTSAWRSEGFPAPVSLRYDEHHEDAVTDSALLTLTTAAAAGVGLVVLAQRLAVPSAALGLLAGVALGPEALGWVQPVALGAGFQALLGLAVAAILFEGALTLDPGSIRHAPDVLGRLVSAGFLIPFVGVAVALWFVLDLPLPVALLGAGLTTAGGPTLVAPLVRRIGVPDRVHHALTWESALVDALAVLVVAACALWLASDPLIGLLGVAAGGSAALLLAMALRAGVVPRDLAGIAALSVALLLYAVCDASGAPGLPAVIAAGLTLGAAWPARLPRPRLHALAEPAACALLVVLVARLDAPRFVAPGWDLPLLLLVALVLRPLSALASTAGRHFRPGERAFLAWVAPRGLLTASLATWFVLDLATPATRALETFAYALVGVTVLQATTAPWLARLLGVEKPPRSAWLFAGDAAVGVALGRALGRAGVDTLVVDPAASDGAPDPHLRLIQGDPASRELVRDPRLTHVSAVLAVSADPAASRAICSTWGDLVGQCYRLARDEEPGGAPAVWRDLQDVEELSTASDLDLLVVDDVGPEDRGRFHGGFAPLFTIKGHRAALIPSPTTHTPAPGDTVVVLRRRVPGLQGLFQDAIIVDEPGSDLYRVVRQLLEAAGEEDPELPIEDVLAGILERERSMSTAMGLGVMIPHTYHPGVDRARCLVANVTAGLRADPPADEPIRLVFLVLSPYGQAEPHLQALAAIARLVIDPDFRALLGRQRDPRRLLALIRERE